MKNRLSATVLSVALGVVLGGAAHAGAQADPQNFMFNSGQTIQPFFDGWSRNDDGSFEMHFGYLNRNYVEELHVPVGAANRMTPGEADRGQPTYFYPRQNRRVFSATVPSDWGEQELIWQVTVNGEPYRAIGWLQPEWEIFASPFVRSEGTVENEPPTLAVEVPAGVTTGTRVTITASVTDDGLPPARSRGAGARATLPTFEVDPNQPTLPVNVPQVDLSVRRRPTRTRVEGVSVTWTQLRGATGVTVEPIEEPAEGTAGIAVTFESSGDYLFKVQASDNRAVVTHDVTVTVQ